MLKFKKLIALSAAATLIFSLAACGKKEKETASEKNAEQNTEQKGSLSEMTKDNITLTYAQWENSKYVEFLAKKFMEKYPNITVQLVSLDQGTWNDGLTNLASAGNLPDAFFYMGNCDVAIRNGWLGDMTEYWQNDPETENVLTTLKDVGYFDSKRKLAAACQFYPDTIFLEKNVFQKLNVPLPDPNWKWSEFEALVKKMTVPEQGIYGYNDYTVIMTYAPIVKNDAWGEFGWDGKKYDMTKDWAEALQTQADWIRAGYHAPAYGSEEAAKAFGDPNIWSPITGKVAMQFDAWWTIDYFASKEVQDKGINMVPYVVPRGDDAKTNHKPAFIDFGTISPASEHPREAYELLKFMGWGVDGWKAKLEATETLKNDDGSKLLPNPRTLPITNDKEIWDGVKALLPQTEEFANFLKYCREPIPLGGASQPGFQTFLDEVLNNGEWGNVQQAVINGDLKAADVAPQLTEKINQYREDAMKELFAE